MPSLHYLNPPPHPFWDFVANLEDHPLFAAYVQPPTANGENGNPAATDGSQPAETGEASNSKKNADKQPSVEDDPSENERAAPKRGIGQSNHHDKPEGNNTKDVPSEPEREWPFRGRGWGGPGRHHPHHHHRRDGPEGHHRGPPPGFGFGFPPFNPLGGQPRGPPGPWSAPNPSNAHHQPPNVEGPRRGRHGCGRHGRRAEGRNEFDLGGFLNNLGNQLGLNLGEAAEGLGLDSFTNTTDNNKADVDFTPRADVFDTSSNYIAHVSLPGAKKNDVGVDWDDENSTLRIAGVVHRPNVDETMMKLLAVDGRKRETGVFEKSITLGTRREPANVDVAGITAKMQDGVLIVTVPKVQKEVEKREVPITSAEPSPVRKDEKAVRFDSQLDGRAAAVATVAEKHEKKDTEMDLRSETEKGDEEMYDGGDEEHEKLPAYHAIEHADDAESSSSSGEEEGEYVKIDVD